MDAVKLVVTRDGQESGNSFPIVVWKEGIEPKYNSVECYWDFEEDKEMGNVNNYINEYKEDEFTEVYGLFPPGQGSSKVMLAQFEWEE